MFAAADARRIFGKEDPMDSSSAAWGLVSRRNFLLWVVDN